MATAELKSPPQSVGLLGPDSAGLRLTPRQFDHAEFEEGWRYELINGVLVVSPIPLEQERDPNGELEYLLRYYRDYHPNGPSLDATLTEHTVKTGPNRRRADRVIWAGLGRTPKRGETPTIVVEFVSEGKRSYLRDYQAKRDEYLDIGVREYWIIDRFSRTLTVFTRPGKRTQSHLVKEREKYSTALLPGFELPLRRLLKLADRWSDD
jgi:Uma2 family endonuclease